MLDRPCRHAVEGDGRFTCGAVQYGLPAYRGMGLEQVQIPSSSFIGDEFTHVFRRHGHTSTLKIKMNQAWKCTDTIHPLGMGKTLVFGMSFLGLCLRANHTDETPFGEFIHATVQDLGFMTTEWFAF